MLHPSHMSVTESRTLDRRHASWHRMCCTLGLLALVLHLFSPNILRASEGEWIEICATSGPVMMKVDLSGDDGAPMPPCPKCKHCTLCVTSAITAVDLAVTKQASDVALFAVCQTTLRIDIPERRYQRPLTRGPPALHIDNNTRAASVSAIKIGGVSCA